jgi:hypothetical protein
MLHAGLDLSRRRLDVCLLSEHGELVAQTAAPPDADGLRGLADRVGRYRQPVRAVIESMNAARFVHDTLEELGWEVLVATLRPSRQSAQSHVTLRPVRAPPGLSRGAASPGIAGPRRESRTRIACEVAHDGSRRDRAVYDLCRAGGAV